MFKNRIDKCLVRVGYTYKITYGGRKGDGRREGGY